MIPFARVGNEVATWAIASLYVRHAVANAWWNASDMYEFRNCMLASKFKMGAKIMAIRLKIIL